MSSMMNRKVLLILRRMFNSTITNFESTVLWTVWGGGDAGNRYSSEVCVCVFFFIPNLDVTDTLKSSDINIIKTHGIKLTYVLLVRYSSIYARHPKNDRR